MAIALRNVGSTWVVYVVDWWTALRHISTERLLVPRNVTKLDMIKIRRWIQLCMKKRWLAGLMTHKYKKLPVTMKCGCSLTSCPGHWVVYVGGLFRTRHQSNTHDAYYSDTQHNITIWDLTTISLTQPNDSFFGSNDYEQFLSWRVCDMQTCVVKWCWQFDRVYWQLYSYTALTDQSDPTSP